MASIELLCSLIRLSATPLIRFDPVCESFDDSLLGDIDYERRMIKRNKDISIGRQMTGYKIMTSFVFPATVAPLPKEALRPGSRTRLRALKALGRPRTPDPAMPCSKRYFEILCRRWKERLHTFEPLLREDFVGPHRSDTA